MEDKRLDALCHTQAYQRRMSRAFNKKVKSRHIQEGDLVLKKNLRILDPRGKFQMSWEGPYIVKKTFSGGATRLTTIDGEELSAPFNVDMLKRYYA